MEISEIAKHLTDGDKVLDVGCANGYSSIQFACAHRMPDRGVDYVPEMVEQVRIRFSQLPPAGDYGIQNHSYFEHYELSHPI
jgi:cyclopropane fatty-acyl-phospholipid synthase-like methyltransferase